MKRRGGDRGGAPDDAPPPSVPVPPLRRDLEWAPIPGDPPAWRLHDPRMGRSLRLDARGREIALRMDRVQAFGTLRERIAEGGRPIAPDALARVLAAFSGLGLLDDDAARDAAGARDGMLERRDARDLPLLVPPDLRFECTACGACCVGVNVGPVTPEIARDLEGELHDALSEATGVAQGFLVTLRPDEAGGDGDDIRICRTRNGACVFLEADGLCAIHRRWGPARKPRVCRLFPYQFVTTPRGIAVGLQTECRDILAASRGAPLAERIDELRAALALAGDIPEARMLLSLDGETTMPFDAYLDLEEEVCRAIEAAGGGGWRCAAIGWNAVAARAAAAGRPLPAPDRDADALRQVLWTFARDLGVALEALRRSCRTRSTRVRFRDDNVALVLEALSDAPLLADRILDDDRGEAARFARFHFVNGWRGKDMLGPPDLVRAASTAGLRWFLIRALAQSRARQVHRLDASAQDVVDAAVAVQMLLRNRRVTPILGRLADRTTTLFGSHLASLVASRARMRVDDPRTDFFLL
jgi:Fe-S-cluster containining protein